eukprot:Sdes_comp17527_c0_seq1m6772
MVSCLIQAFLVFSCFFLSTHELAQYFQTNTVEISSHLLKMFSEILLRRLLLHHKIFVCSISGPGLTGTSLRSINAQNDMMPLGLTTNLKFYSANLEDNRWTLLKIFIRASSHDQFRGCVPISENNISHQLLNKPTI